MGWEEKIRQSDAGDVSLVKEAQGPVLVFDL